jgi:general secretion pathway protein L
VTFKRASSAISRLWDWWVDELAELTVPRRTLLKPWQVILIRSGEGFDIHTRQGAATPKLGHLDAGVTDERARVIARDLVGRGMTPDTTLLRLHSSEVVTKRLSLPAGVHDMLGPVLRNQIERHAPWPAEQAMFTYREAGTDADRLSVDLWIVGRNRLEKNLGELNELGFKIGVVDAADSIDDIPGFNFLGSSEVELKRPRAIMRRVLATAAALALFGCLASVSYAYYLGLQRDELDETVKRELNAAMSASTPEAAKARRLRELVASQRQRAPSMAVTLEMLSRTLPDTAYLERLELRGNELTVSGRAQNVPELIGPLEETPHFEDVRFAAPTTRREGDSIYEFSLSLRLKPLMTVDRAR